MRQAPELCERSQFLVPSNSNLFTRNHGSGVIPILEPPLSSCRNIITLSYPETNTATSASEETRLGHVRRTGHDQVLRRD